MQRNFNKYLKGCMLMCLLAIFPGCREHTSLAPLEKGGPVTATGYVDLIPPTNYSPVRGVLCESLSIDENGALSGSCYDLNGPSVPLTRKYISDPAATALKKKIEMGAFKNSRRFTMETGIVCDVDERRCWFTRRGTDFEEVEAPKHTKALFGFS